uniref:Serine/threonine-protein phosphatase n=1 Tax=Rhizophora mucronata TaxID=61149 RepID=A0A2P2MSJ1_RHIMU
MVDNCLPLGVASAVRSLSGNSTSPLTCRAFAAARVALIASASAADASTKYSTPLLVLLGAGTIAFSVLISV